MAVPIERLYYKYSSHSINSFKFIFISFILSWIRSAKAAEILIKSTQGLQKASVAAQVAQFGAPIPDNGLVGYIVRSRPADACRPLISPTNEDDMDFWVKPRIMLAQQGPCLFSDQVDRAEQAGFRAVIIFSNSSDELRLMRRVPPALANSSNSLTVLFVGQHDGLQLWHYYTGSNGYYIVISSKVPRREFIAWDLVLILIPIFIVVVPLSFILFMTFVSGRRPLFLTAYRQAQRRTNFINGLPERKISKNETTPSVGPNGLTTDLENETLPMCSICLEGYKPGDKVRTLPPCSHEFHSACVDPWLLSDHLVCPLCRHQVELPEDPSARKVTGGPRHRIFSIPLVTLLASSGHLIRQTYVTETQHVVRTTSAGTQSAQEHTV